MHKPVLLREVTDLLNIRKGYVYVDCTLGLGGHSLEILEKLEGHGKLIGIEQDESSLKIAKDRLKDYPECYLFSLNFLELKKALNSLGLDKISGGVLLDLGFNSYQLEDENRGFSFKMDSPLDMRMNRNKSLSAYEVVNSYSEAELAEIFYKYGEERFSRRIAGLIVEKRSKSKAIKTTKELANIVIRAYPKVRKYKIHPATKIFQAIRIEVNNELENLEKFLCFVSELLLPTSRLIVISFHSLEDRIVKNFLKSNREFDILTKKPVVPTSGELKDNLRARSAKLRAAERI